MAKTIQQKRERKSYRVISTIGIITACLIPICWIIILICYFSSTKIPKTIMRDYTYVLGIITLAIGIPLLILFIAIWILYLGFNFDLLYYAFKIKLQQF